MKLLKHIAPLLVPIILACQSCKTDKNNNPVYPTNCALSLAGLYTGSDICPSSSPLSYTATITVNTDSNITISNLYGVPVTAKPDCAHNTITIPTQTFAGNFSISGTGTYTANRIIINWNGTSLGTPVSCTTTYTR